MLPIYYSSRGMSKGTARSLEACDKAGVAGGVGDQIF